MTILVMGNAGLIRRSTIDALSRGPHHIRLFAADAAASAKEWPAHVEPWPFESASTSAVEKACRGCHAVIVLDSADAEDLHDAREANEPRVAVRNIRPIVDAATAAEVTRVVYLAPLRQAPEDRQQIDEEIRRFSRDWLVIRHGPVYGPGDPTVSRTLILMRSLPVIPLVGGMQRLQPLWHGDLADALVAAIESPRAEWRQVVPVVGPESITLHDLYEHIAVLIGRRPPRIPVPEFVSAYGSHVAELLHVTTDLLPTFFVSAANGRAEPLSASGSENLSDIFGVRPTRLDDGLKRLANEQAELVPADGVGSIEIKRFRADIRDSAHTALSLMRLFKVRFTEIMPIPFGVEPVSPHHHLTQGLTLTARMPLRGHVQVRVEEATERQVTLATLEGHPLSGIVRFSTEDVAGGVRFEVLTCDRASNAVDWLIFTLGGGHGQSANWQTVVRRVVEASGGTADVQQITQTLTAEEAEDVDATIGAFVQRHRPAATHRAHP